MKAKHFSGSVLWLSEKYFYQKQEQKTLKPQGKMEKSF